MRNVLLACLLVNLAGCKIQTEVANRENAVQIANKENAVHVEKDAVGHVDQGAVTVEKDAVHVEKDALHLEKDAVGHVEPGAFKVEPGAFNVTGTIQQGAIQLPMTVQQGAVQIRGIANVSEGAIKVNLVLNVAEGAIVIKGAEAGAIQTKFETPWWGWLIMSILGVGWLITKFRKQTRSRSFASKEIQEASIWDIFF